MNRSRTFTSQAYLQRDHQRGAALFVSLVFLLILTVLALSMSQTTTVEERIAANSRDARLTFQGAESALAQGRALVSTPGGAVPDPDPLAPDPYLQDQDWWQKNATEYGDAGTQQLAQLLEDPRYYLTMRAQVDNAGSMKVGSKHHVDYFDVTAHAFGKTGAEVMTSDIVAIPR